MLKKWLAIILAAMLILTPVTASAKGFGHFGGRSSYSSSFGGSRSFSSHSGFGSSGSSYGSSSRSFSGLFGSHSSTRYRSYARPSFGSHFASFGLGMLIGGMFHPFGGYYGYGGMYGYHPFGFLHFILDIIVLLIVLRILRNLFFRR